MNPPSLHPLPRPARLGRSSVGQARSSIMNWIQTNAIRPGELLPSERVLAAILSLDRGTLRRALKILQTQGILTREARRLVVCSPSLVPWVSRTIIVLLPKLDLLDHRSTPWKDYVTLGISQAVREQGYHALTLDASSLNEQDLHELIAARPFGVLLPEINSDANTVLSRASAFSDAQIPVVAYGDDPALARFDRVVSDHTIGCYQLTRAILERGFRPIRFWRQPTDTWWLNARSLGYIRAMTEAGHSPLALIPFPDIPTHQPTSEAFQNASKQLIGFLLEVLQGPHRANALMLTSDRDTFYAAHALQMLGLEPGKNVLIAGYDNYFNLCEEMTYTPYYPALTVDKHNEHTGREMLRLLLDRINGTISGASAPMVRIIEPQLIVTDRK